MDENRLTFVDLGRKGLTMHQLKDGFRFGTDTVLLSWFTASCIKEGKKVACLELGANCGAASLLLVGRRDCVQIDALELDRDACEVLKLNIKDNGLEERISAYEGDVRELPGDIRQKQYDAVFMNPPFYRESAGPTADVIGRSETDGTLEVFVQHGGVIDRLLLGCKGIQVAAHPFQLIQYLEGTAFLGSLEGGMFHKMCQSLLARQFMTRTGSDGIATIHHLLPGSRQVNDS